VHRWLARNIVFPLHERAKGHETLAILRDMQAVDCLNTVNLANLQRQRLRAFISYCYAHVPYIRTMMQQAGAAPRDICDIDDLIRLPLMTKADVRQNRHLLRSAIATGLSSFSSGGSTGEPLVFDISKRRIASRVACRQRVSRWWGLSIGDSEIALWGSPLELTKQDWVRRIRDKALRTRLLSAYELDDATMSSYLDVIEQGGIRQIFAYPNAMHRLCLHATKQGRSLRRAGVKVVFLTSEVLYPYQREVITETFNCPVANGYGGRDSGFISHECPQGGMHILADAVVVEVVDNAGVPVPLGEVGQIVVTDLYSEEAPFLRYVTGDVGAISKRACMCGRALPLLERIDGRSNDCIITPDGRAMHGQSLVGLIMEIEGIERFRIYQKRPDCFHVQIVRNEHYRPESEERIRKSWSDRLRTRLEIGFEYPDSLPNERSGKFRHIISQISEQPQTSTAGRS
jgi:phenylacetate-CoA ligase